MKVKRDFINLALSLFPLIFIIILLANSVLELVTGSLFWQIEPSIGAQLFLISCFAYPIVILRSVQSNHKEK